MAKQKRTGLDNSADECPWGWCDGDQDIHDLLCYPSKIMYGSSSAWTWTEKELIEEWGVDVWTRDEEGNITGLKEDELERRRPQ
jgi:hypothetical protein